MDRQMEWMTEWNSYSLNRYNDKSMQAGFDTNHWPLNSTYIAPTWIAVN